jgi:hypothetical protein
LCVQVWDDPPRPPAPPGHRWQWLNDWTADDVKTVLHEQQSVVDSTRAGAVTLTYGVNDSSNRLTAIPDEVSGGGAQWCIMLLLLLLQLLAVAAAQPVADAVAAVVVVVVVVRSGTRVLVVGGDGVWAMSLALAYTETLLRSLVTHVTMSCALAQLATRSGCRAHMWLRFATSMMTTRACTGTGSGTHTDLSCYRS